MLRISHEASSFDETKQERNMPDRSSPPTAPSSWSIVTALRIMVAPLVILCDALRDGLAARRQYEHLRSSGIPHDTALREALGIASTPHMRHEKRPSNCLCPKAIEVLP